MAASDDGVEAVRERAERWGRVEEGVGVGGALERETGDVVQAEREGGVEEGGEGVQAVSHHEEALCA